MLDFIKHLIEADVGTLVARAVLVVLFATLYFLLFVFAKKRNLLPYTYMVVCVIVALFALSFFVQASELAFYVYFALIILVVLALILFSQDINRSLFRLSISRSLFKENATAHYGTEELKHSVDEIVKACLRLSKTDTGALIIIADHLSDTILDSGIKVNAEITAELLETLFFPKTALHDGAVVISANKVVAAGCYLPLTQATNLPREFGTRHRAAIGVATAFPDLTAIVVSEETGIISAMHDTKIKRYLGAQQLQEILMCAMGLSDDSAEDTIWGGQGK
ncbi:MAG: DNA integrity scanning protein DisA nucleotide-binding domain protein [Clostridiales bacterium]|nr:DNA integrity scanning protein DisA nucleotide-binding domain protein [Clostridiales bacterium]